jgi:hypothetical protein
MALCRVGLVDAVGLAWPRLERSGTPELDGERSQPRSRAADPALRLLPISTPPPRPRAAGRWPAQHRKGGRARAGAPPPRRSTAASAC